MKRFDELSPDQQVKAQAYMVNNMLDWVSSGETEGLPADVQASIQAVNTHMERLGTPWFFAAALFEREAQFFNQTALALAQEGLYSEPSDSPIYRIPSLFQGA
jgi:hypothetical protein